MQMKLAFLHGKGLPLRLISLVSSAHTQAAHGGVLADKVRGKLKIVVLHNINSLVLSSSQLGDGGLHLTVHQWPIELHLGVFVQFHKSEYKS